MDVSEFNRFAVEIPNSDTGLFERGFIVDINETDYTFLVDFFVGRSSPIWITSDQLYAPLQPEGHWITAAGEKVEVLVKLSEEDPLTWYPAVVVEVFPLLTSPLIFVKICVSGEERVVAAETYCPHEHEQRQGMAKTDVAESDFEYLILDRIEYEKRVIRIPDVDDWLPTRNISFFECWHKAVPWTKLIGKTDTSLELLLCTSHPDKQFDDWSGYAEPWRSYVWGFGEKRELARRAERLLHPLDDSESEWSDEENTLEYELKRLAEHLMQYWTDRSDAMDELSDESTAGFSSAFWHGESWPKRADLEDDPVKLAKRSHFYRVHQQQITVDEPEREAKRIVSSAGTTLPRHPAVDERAKLDFEESFGFHSFSLREAGYSRPEPRTAAVDRTNSACQSESVKCYMDDLPGEILQEIFRYLDINDRHTMMRVSTNWETVLRHPDMQRTLIISLNRFCGDIRVLFSSRIVFALRQAISTEARHLVLDCQDLPGVVDILELLKFVQAFTIRAGVVLQLISVVHGSFTISKHTESRALVNDLLTQELAFRDVFFDMGEFENDVYSMYCECGSDQCPSCGESFTFTHVLSDRFTMNANTEFWAGLIAMLSRYCKKLWPEMKDMKETDILNAHNEPDDPRVVEAFTFIELFEDGFAAKVKKLGVGCIEPYWLCVIAQHWRHIDPYEKHRFHHTDDIWDF